MNQSTNQTGTPIIIGSGAFRYEADHNWAKLPDHVRLGCTHGVVEAADGSIIIANQSPHAVIRFDPDGNFLGAWGEEFATGAHGLSLVKEAGGEFLYLSNTSLGEVVKTTLKGEVVWRIGTPALPAIYNAEKRFVPTETTVAPDGTVYVADGYGQPYVHIYDANAKYLGSFGGHGSEPGKLDQPHGLCIHIHRGSPTVLVANRKNRRIDRFSLAGAFVETIIGPENLRFPCTVIPCDGRLFIPDLFGRLSIFDDTNNRLLAHLGDYIEGREWNRPFKAIPELDPRLAGYPNIAREHRLPGRFSSPHGLCVDRHRNIFVVEWIEDGRITRLRKLPS